MTHSVPFLSVLNIGLYKFRVLRKLTVSTMIRKWFLLLVMIKHRIISAVPALNKVMFASKLKNAELHMHTCALLFILQPALLSLSQKKKKTRSVDITRFVLPIPSP